MNEARPATSDGLDLDRKIAALQSPIAPATAKTGRMLLWQALCWAALSGVLVLGVLPFMDSAAVLPCLVLLSYWFWRNLWAVWITLRAQRFRRKLWPQKRRAADKIWQEGWRPARLHVQITACFEAPEITRRAIFELVRQIQQENIAATLYYGTTSAYDEAILAQFVDEARQGAVGLDLELVFIRLRDSGHDVPMGDVLREIRRWGAQENDLILFLDDDTILGPRTLQKTLPLFAADPALQLATTDQAAICIGPDWVCDWLRLRFAQRRQELSAQSLSGRFLPLSGRVRFLRAGAVLDEGFIRQQEQKQRRLRGAQKHFRLSVVDALTWVHLLRNQGHMSFVPDVSVISISLLKDLSLLEQASHLRRWSGEAMRNALQVLALGPGVVSGFIWWRVLDRRVSMALSLCFPLLLLWGEQLAPGFALVWVALWLLSRYALGLFVLENRSGGAVLWYHTFCVTLLIHLSVSVLDWLNGLRLMDEESREEAGREELFPAPAIKDKIQGEQDKP